MPSDCLDILKKRPTSEPAPSCVADERCSYIKANQSRKVTFSFLPRLSAKDDAGVEQPLPLAEQKKNWDCLAGLLTSRGAKVLETATTIYIAAEGTYAQVEPVFAVSLVSSVEVGCSAGTCAECLSKAVDQCGADPFCREIRASRLNRARTCTKEPEAVGCTRATQACNQEFTYAADSRGDCWIFGSSCVPTGWRITPECTPPPMQIGVCTPAELP
jgi:hypothetical protein